MRFLSGAFGRVPGAVRLAAPFIGDPLPVLGWKPFARRQLVYDLPSGKLALLNDPAAIETVMFDRRGRFPKSHVVEALLRPLVGAGVFAQPGGDGVKRVRRCFIRTLAALPDARIEAVSRKIASNYLARWIEAGEVDIDAELSRLTVDIVSELTLGARFDDAQSRRFTDLFARYHHKAKPGLLMLARGRREVHDAIVAELGLARIGEETRAMIADRFVKGRDPGTVPFLAALAEAGADVASGDRMVDETAVMLLAGHETTASTLSWLMRELAETPALQEEAANALAAGVAESLIAGLVNETLRLYPPIGFFLRENLDAMPLVDMELPAGSLALVSPRTLHRHADYWQEPDRFDPHRWQNGTPAGAEGAFLPFGSGARLCPGARFAGIEMNAILQNLLSRAVFSAVPTRRAKPLWNLTARPDRPIRLRVAPREAPQSARNHA